MKKENERINGCGKLIGNWKCGTIFSEEGKEDKLFLCMDCKVNDTNDILCEPKEKKNE